MRTLAFIAIACAYVLTPYLSFGFDSTCECVHGGHKCGTDAYICLCCMGSAEKKDCPEFSECGSKIHIDLYTQPQAEAVPSPGPAPAEVGPVQAVITVGQAVPGYAPPLFKPPRSLSRN